MTQSKKRTRKVFKPLAIAALMTGAMLQPFMLPAFAAAGDQISNTATATYEDDNGTPFETESNTVVVTVSEIAGITVEATGINDGNGGSVEANDELDFNFEVTNVGNDTTDVRLPGLDDLITTNFTPTQIEVFNAAGALCGTITGNAPVLMSALSPGCAPLGAGEFITVVVTGNVTAPPGGLNPGDDIRVTLGNTPPNDNTAATQNQPADANDSNVATVDLSDGTAGEADGVLPAADQKEASATQFVDFATEQMPLALATVTKAASSVDPGATGAASDDVITYDLTLTVENTSPSGAFIPAALDKTPILLNAGTGPVSTDVVLVSDTIPETAVFKSVNTAPAGWQAVYSVSDPSTTSPVVATGATPAIWTTTPPATLSDVTRIGFIYDGTPAPATLAANGTAITGFQFEVTTSGLPAVGGSIYNLAQAFGTTFDDPANPNDPVDQIIYDESGDDNPNNFNDNGTAPTETDGGTPDGSDFNPVTDTGEADPSGGHGTDNGTNTGTGPEGEDNLVVLTGEEVVGDDNILNGPNGSPGAVGPGNDDDLDYTNAGIDSDDAATTPVIFTNTVANPAGNTSQIDNVTLQPISPALAEANDEGATTGEYGVNADIPVGTLATITYQAQSATYEWNGTNWVIQAGDTPVNVGTLQPGDSLNYTVTLDFSGVAPANLPADKDVIPVAIIAFPNTGAAGFNSETVNNITINRLYVGFMDLVKEARVFDDSGALVQNWTDDSTLLANADIESGYVIEYRISYENISPPVVGSGNVGLTARNFRVIEDGDNINDPGIASGTNTWHDDVAADALTVHANGVTNTTGTVRYYQELTEDNASNEIEIGTVDPADGAVVEGYVNEVGDVVPAGSGSMIIRRTVK